ncbi:hypothetical protein JZU56_04855 [bacterium]|nr:hypothetical protein [bacterium]
MFTLAIQNTTEFSVKFTIKDGKTFKTFAFSLTAKRIDDAELSAHIRSINENIAINKRASEHGGNIETFDIKGFIVPLITDWIGQRLVLGADGQPAEFSPDALDALLNVSGVADVIYSAYLKEVRAKEKN